MHGSEPAGVDLSCSGVLRSRFAAFGVLRLPFRAPFALSHATVVRQPEHARCRGEAGRRIGANGFAVTLAEQVSGIEVKALLPRHARLWFMAWCMSSRFPFVAPWCMAWCMSTIKPRLDGAMRKPGFPCYLPRRFALLAKVESVLFENGRMGFHAAFCWRSRIAAAFSKARLAAASYCAAVGHPAT